MSNLNAFVDFFLHPEIPYFDKEHLIVGSVSGIGTTFLLGLILLNINWLQKSNMELGEKDEKLLFINKAVESSSDSIALSDATGYHFYHNKAFSDLFEYSTAEERQAAGDNTIIVKDPKVAKEIFSNIMSGKPWSGELDLVTKSGRVFTAFEQADAIKDNHGKIVGLIERITDISSRKKVEAEITHLNEQLKLAIAEKDKFFSIIAHDLRSPFNAFLGFTRLMVEDLPSLTLEEIQKISSSMRNSATNLFSLLENLLEWSRLQQGLIAFDSKTVQLSQIVDESLATVLESAKNKELDITIEIPDHLLVFVDSYILQSVIRNLVSNAVKFTSKGGKISITGKALKDGSVEISIGDTGIGMSPTMVENLFRLDVPSNRKGTDGEPSTGLGLIICKDFIEKHGGKIWVESEVGQWSKFNFIIPGHPIN
jgi:PAS domain S-box-containing protein